MIRFGVVFLCFFSLSFELLCQDKIRSTVNRYVKVPVGYLMVLRQNDRVLEQLENFARAEKIPCCELYGYGFRGYYLRLF